MALADTADTGVAAHLSQRLDVVREQQRALPHARGGQRRLGAGMATANDDHIKFLGYNMQRLRGARAQWSTNSSRGVIFPPLRRCCARTMPQRCST